MNASLNSRRDLDEASSSDLQMSLDHRYSSSATRAQRSHRFWVWFWAVVAAALLVFAIAMAHDAASVLVAGFLSHPHS
jgi:hypothetical protein